MFSSIYFQEAADPLTRLPGYAAPQAKVKGARRQAQRAHLGPSRVALKLSEKFMEETGGGNFMQICSLKRGEDGKQVAAGLTNWKYAKKIQAGDPNHYCN